MENFIIANCTDTGKVRDLNEDSMAAFDTPNGYVVVVCDGMGGQNAGDVASQLAVTVINDILTDNVFATPQEAITSSIIAANKAILIQASRNPELSGMGSTCVMAIVKDGKVYYGSVGDSRIYYIAQNMIRQITKDQSYVQTLVDAGEITPMMAESHVDKNQITNALGIESMTPPVVSETPITPEPDSMFLLCSDGLTGMISNNTIVKTLAQPNMTLQQRAEMLVQQANEAGGSDNITVQLIAFPSANSKVGGKMGVSGQPNGKKADGKLKGKMLVTTIITVVIVVACVIAAAWFFLNKNEKEQTVKQPTTHQVEKTNVQHNNQPIVNKTETTRVVIEKTEKKKEKKPDYKSSITKKKQTPTKNRVNNITKINDKKEPSEDEIFRSTRHEIIDK